MPPSSNSNSNLVLKNNQTKHLPKRLVTEEDYDYNPPSVNINRQLISKTNKDNEQKLYIITFNVKTLSSYEKLIELTESLKSIKTDIIGMSEVRRLGEKIEEYEDFILYYMGQTPGQFGVGFLVRKKS